MVQAAAVFIYLLFPDWIEIEIFLYELLQQLEHAQYPATGSRTRDTSTW
jgi:hypothetical protein